MEPLATRQAYPRGIAPHIAMLVNALTAVGITAMPFGDTMVWAHNPAADPPEDGHPRVWRLNPGLRQAVQLHRCTGGCCLGWFWVWHSQGQEPEYEYIALASEVEAVAARVARVLAVRPEVTS